MKGKHTVRTIQGFQEVLVINEPGVYKLTFTSRKKEADEFTEMKQSETDITLLKGCVTKILRQRKFEHTSTFFESKDVLKIEQVFNRRKSAFGSVRRIVESNLVVENSTAKTLKHVSESQ